MPRLKYSLLAVAGIVLLAVVLSVIGPKRALAALGYTPIMDVENPGLHPFQTVLTSGGSFTVPAKQRLVIDTIDGEFTTHSATTLNGLGLSTQTNGLPFAVTHNFPVTLTGKIGSLSDYYATQHVQIYADPGTTVQFIMFTNDIGSSGQLNISGHLVDVP